MSLTSPRRPRRLASAALAVAAMVAVAACSTGAGQSAAPSASPSASTAAAYEVKAVQDPKLGTYLTGEDGKTLYVFTKDTAGSGKSVCSGDCAAKWPPFVLDSGETVKGGAGVTGTFATITRDDGKTQVAYEGRPLYYFATDTKAGDVNGQGIGGVWFVAAAAGGPGGAAASPAASAADSAAPSTSADGGKYGSSSSPATDSIIDYAFSPASITVAVGTKVTWTNTGSRAHTVTADDGSFDSGSLSNGATFIRTFDKAGTFAFHCAIHPGMKGTIVVQ